MRKPLFVALTFALSGILAIATATSLQAAKLKVIAGGSMTASMNAIAPAFEKATGHKLVSHFDSTPNIITRVTSGTPFDVAVVPVDVFKDAAAKARFAVYVGGLGADTAATAREILAKVPTPDNAVLLAVSPNQKAIEVVYGSEVKGRGIEEAAPLGVSAAAASFREGNLIDGLISAVRVLSAGVSPR